MRTYCLIIVLFLFHLAPLCYSALSSGRGSSASFMSLMLPVDLNVDDPWVIEMANFAVTEHNKRSNANLKLAQILSCRGFIFTTTNIYTLELLVNDRADTKKYSARLIDDMITPTGYKLRSFELTASPPTP
ncbi:hypothetical protein PIB30_032854 [Stylosanthes scabra]|uniref:Cystatin domain-containing protein n=1 Tax=Stylosanthes scabra TaxID=79078 RepID=A0ABU6RCF0_9FABA|nr:hypothetical protein [Stylosanthes scabra]